MILVSSFRIIADKLENCTANVQNIYNISAYILPIIFVLVLCDSDFFTLSIIKIISLLLIVYHNSKSKWLDA